jgi:hypothetical protein
MTPPDYAERRTVSRRPPQSAVCVQNMPRSNVVLSSTNCPPLPLRRHRDRAVTDNPRLRADRSTLPSPATQTEPDHRPIHRRTSLHPLLLTRGRERTCGDAIKILGPPHRLPIPMPRRPRLTAPRSATTALRSLRAGHRFAHHRIAATRRQDSELLLPSAERFHRPAVRRPRHCRYSG